MTDLRQRARSILFDVVEDFSEDGMMVGVDDAVTAIASALQQAQPTNVDTVDTSAGRVDERVDGVHELDNFDAMLDETWRLCGADNDHPVYKWVLSMRPQGLATSDEDISRAIYTHDGFTREAALTAFQRVNPKGLDAAVEAVLSAFAKHIGKKGLIFDDRHADAMRNALRPHLRGQVPDDLRQLSDLATHGEVVARVIERNGETVDAFLTVPSVVQGHSIAGPIPMELLADDSYRDGGPEQKAHDARFTAAAINFVRSMLAASAAAVQEKGR